jgi:acetyl esterase/lipase
LYFHGGVYVLGDAFQVTLGITPGVPHVFQTFYRMLDEATAALDSAGQLLTAHLTSAERVTG